MGTYSNEKIEGTIDKGARKLEDMGREGAQRASDTASDLSKKGSEMMDKVGEKVSSFTQKVHDMVDKDCAITDKIHDVTKKVEESGKYLTHTDPQQMAADVTSMIRRNPITSLLVGIGCGYLIGSNLLRSKVGNA